jgi:Icc-related predicted phosphoesterase
MQYKILYTSDIHGNEAQYKKLADFAFRISPDSIIIGGDIAPKGFPLEVYIESQREFLESRLPELLHPLKAKLPGCRLFLMMGNDDCAANMDVLEKGSSIYQIIHNKRIRLTKEFDLVGYSYVPITPFAIKDWEKYDFSNTPQNLQSYYKHRKKVNSNLEGLKSTKSGWREFRFDSEIEKTDSIQKDFESQLFQKDADKTVYVIHTPPDKTNLDQAAGGNHVGSMAVRRFIETRQPYLTLHGHIHETVDISGNFKDKIRNTLCLASGNDNAGSAPAVLVFDLYAPQDARRILL